MIFLFTDIEGSTKLWEQHPQAMAVVLEQHDRIIRQAIETHHGHIFKTGGDAFFVVFDDPYQALNTTIEIQKEIAAQTQLLRLRVRTALHSGEAEFRDKDYFGITLNQLSRILGVTYGGQILLSQAMQRQ